MRRLAVRFAVGVFVCAGLVLAQGGGAPAKAKATAPEIPFEVVPKIKLLADIYMGEAVSVATNSKGHVFVGDAQWWKHGCFDSTRSGPS